MFRCPITNRVSKPGEKPHYLVLKTREKLYTKEVENEETCKIEEVVIGEGYEIVKALYISQSGLDIWNAANADEKANLADNL